MEESRIRWGCRRGMLELDIILQRFFDERYPQLSEVERASFVELLSCTDPELFSWLMGHGDPEPEYQHIVKLIRAHGPHP